MAEVYRDHEIFIEANLDLCQVFASHQGRVLISIDGIGGSGKSSLAASLAPVMGARVVSLDNTWPDRSQGMVET